MKTYNLMPVLAVAASFLFFSTPGYAAYQVNYSTEDYITDVDTGGDGTTYTDADYYPNSYAYVLASIDSQNDFTWAAADAYIDKKMYITDYDPETDPNLTARAVVIAHAQVWASGDTEDSTYLAVAESNCYAYGCGLSGNCCAYAQAVVFFPDEGDDDLDLFWEDVDVSYTGATIYFGNSAEATAYAFITSGEVTCEAENMPASSVGVWEN
jgi:hypothetical protein